MKKITKHVPVLIVGGGPVGLSLALALARQDVPSLTIERNSVRNEHPRARGVSMRTMELLRQWGDISELLKYEFPKEAIRFIWATSLQGSEITRVELKGRVHYSHGPIGASFITQDCVEEYLHHNLKNHPQAEIEFAKEMISFTEDDTGVVVRILNKKNNQQEFVHTKYLLAADGAHSHIRKQISIEMEGPNDLGRFCSVYCEFDISKWTAHRPCIGFFFTDPKITNRSLFTAYGKNRWIVGMRFTKEDSKGKFTDEYCLSEIRRVLDLPDLKVKIINKNFWTMAAQVAKQYHYRKIFLVGDAAHRLPPTGGLGMNTGIQDAHNLAWKLALVLNYHISDSLLDTYYDERAPIAKRNLEWSTENAQRFVEIAAAIYSGGNESLKTKLQDQQANHNYEGLDLGFIYHSNAVLSENDQLLSVSPAKYVATTLPGSRAPHVELIKNGQTISTLDLYEREYVLLIGSFGQAWEEALNQLTQVLLIPIKSYRVGDDGDLIDSKNIWHTIYEISSTGALLIRPDGHVAWRSKEMVVNPWDTLNGILNSLHLK